MVAMVMDGMPYLQHPLGGSEPHSWPDLWIEPWKRGTVQPPPRLRPPDLYVTL